MEGTSIHLWLLNPRAAKAELMVELEGTSQLSQCAGDAKEALEALNEVEETLVMYNARLLAYAQAASNPSDAGRCGKRALSLLQEVKEKGLVPNVMTMTFVISCCSNASQSLSSEEWASEAFTQFGEMKQNGLKPSPATYGALASSAVTLSQVSADRATWATQVTVLMDELVDSGVRVDSAVANNLIAAVGNVVGDAEVLGFALKLGIPAVRLSRFLGTEASALIGLCDAMCRLAPNDIFVLEWASIAFEEKKKLDAAQTKINAKEYSHLLSICVNVVRLSGRNAAAREWAGRALLLHKEMNRFGLEPAQPALGIRLIALFTKQAEMSGNDGDKMKMIDEAWELIEFMKSKEWHVSYPMLKTLLFACTNGVKLTRDPRVASRLMTRALELFDCVNAAGGFLNTIEYSIMFSAISNAGRLQDSEKARRNKEARHVYSKMKEQGIEWDAKTASTLINSFLVSGDSESAEAVLMEARANRRRLDAFPFNSLIRYYLRFPEPFRADLAYSVLNEMNEARIPGNDMTVRLRREVVEAFNTNRLWQGSDQKLVFANAKKERGLLALGGGASLEEPIESLKRGPDEPVVAERQVKMRTADAQPMRRIVPQNPPGQQFPPTQHYW